MTEEGSGLAELSGDPVELKAVPGFGFLPNHVVDVTNLLFQVKNMMRRSVEYGPFKYLK